MPVTAISFWGLSFKILYETSDNNFLTFEEYKYIIFLFFFIIFFSETIIFAPFAIAFLMKLFPSTFVPLIAILLGFLPGCGPQIIVTTFYLNGYIPLSAEMGNAIANDGDALFPAIALAPKAAIIATLYSGIPAIIVAYGYMYLFE